jgi:myo-inositol-1(or 4)-monophosphatase
MLETALAAAEAAASVHAASLGSVEVSGAEEKGRMDFVSRVDLEAQRAALAVISARHPNHAVLAEEEDGEDGPSSVRGGAGPIWVVDPLDGTANFLHRHPMHCASVGVVMDGEPVVGAVVSAPLGDRWWGARGMGAFRNGTPIHASRATSIGRGLVGTGFPFKAIDRLDPYLSGFASVLRNSAGIRRGGSAALDLCHLAEGVLTAFWEITLAPWDVAGGLAILNEAGGVAGRIEGGPIPVLEAGSVLAAGTAEAMEELRALVS